MFLRNPPSRCGSSGFRGTHIDHRCCIHKMSPYRPTTVSSRAKSNFKYFRVSEQVHAVLVRVFDII